jgi:hypothetical protein
MRFWGFDETLETAADHRTRKSQVELELYEMRHVNLSVLCLTYQVLHVCVVCLCCAWKGDRSYRHAIGWPNVFWNSGVHPWDLVKW